MSSPPRAGGERPAPGIATVALRGAARTAGVSRAAGLVAAAALTAVAGLFAPGCLATKPGVRDDVHALDKDVRAVLARCAAHVPEEAYVDPRVDPDCVLPPGIAALLRVDVLDDERDDAPPRWERLVSYDGALSAAELQAMLERFVSPDGTLSARVLHDADGGSLLPEPVLAPSVSVRLRSTPSPKLSVTEGPPQAGAQLLLSPAPERSYRPQQWREVRAAQVGRPQEDSASTSKVSEAGVQAGAKLLLSPTPERPYRPERWAELRAERSAERPYGRLRVAIDPGHLGGDYARVESRLYVWQRTEDGGQRAFAEGDLTLRTALELAKKLGGHGVDARLTRTSAEPRYRRAPAELRERAVRFDRRLTADPAFLELLSRVPADAQRRLRVAAILHALRVQLTSFDLVERVRALEDWQPDVLLSIHYNAGAWATGTRAATALVAMVRGTVQRHRLYSPAARVRALRDAFEIDELNAATHLGAACLAAMSESLGLPVIAHNHYGDHTPIVRADGSPLGVDAWNGLVLRAATWPAVLLEGPYMNEGDEAPRLAAALEAPLHTPGTRTERYAEGVARGVRAWASRWLDSERNAFGPVEADEYRAAP